jgi:hypothetical protein
MLLVAVYLYGKGNGPQKGKEEAEEAKDCVTVLWSRSDVRGYS